MKQRVSLSINKKTIEKIDQLVDNVYIKNRSDAIEKILNNHLKNMKTCVILAGGNMKSEETIRPLLKIGQETLIENTLKKTRKAGFNQYYIIGQQKNLSKIYEQIGNGQKLDVNIEYIQEEKTRGSAKTLEKVKNKIKNDFLIIPIDHYFNFDIKKIYDHHKQHNALITFGIHSQTNFPFNKGIVEMDGEKIINYWEKPTKPKTYLANTFIGFMNPKIFNHIPPGEINWSLQENIFPKIANQRKMNGYPVSGEWVNVHTKKDAELATKIEEQKK